MSPARTASIALAVSALAAGCIHVAPAPIDPSQRALAFEARALDGEALHGFLAATLGDEGRRWPLESWDARTLAAAALFYEPSVAAARARARAAAAAVETAGALPNPTIALTPERSTNPGAAISPWLAAVAIDWPIETAGKRARRVEAARAQAVSATLALGAQAWSVRHRVATALLDVLAARRRIAWLGREVEAERTLVARLDERIAAGAATAGDAAPLRLAFLESEHALAGERAGEQMLLATLAEAVGLPLAALASAPLAPNREPGRFATASRTESLRPALFERPDVLAALADYAAAEAALRLELAKQWPDLHLGPGYQFDQGENKWSLGLALKLPLLDRNQGPIREAIMAREAAAVAFDATQARVMAEVDLALARRDGAGAERALLTAIAADRARNLERAQEALRLGEADRVVELAAEVEWLRSARARDEGELAWQRALADLEAAVQPAADGLVLAAAAGGPP